MTAVASWINKGGNPLPEWIEPHRVGRRDPNGTFLIKTKRGRDDVQARVLIGNIALLRGEVVHTCPADEARTFLADLAEAEAPAPALTENQTRKSLEADVAPRIDDTDDISRRISGVHRNSDVPTPLPVPRRGVSLSAPPRKPAPKPQRKQAYPPPKGRRPMIEWIPPSELKIDDAYQRRTENQASQRLITSIAANFDWRLCTPLVVSRRADGSFAVIDGQHRTLAARLRGMDDLPCCVFTYDSLEEEAKMFIAANRQRKAMNRLDDFYAALAAADDDALQVQQLVAAAGLTVARNTSSTAWQPGEIAFTSSIVSVLRKHGREITATALRHIAEAFPDQKVAHSGSIFLGLVKLLANPPEGFDPDRLFAAMLKYDADGWGSFVAGLKGGDTRACAIRDALMMAYDETPAEAV